MGVGGEGGGWRFTRNINSLGFKRQPEIAYLQLVDKLSTSLQIRCINQFSLLALIFFKQSDHTNKKTKQKPSKNERKKRTISLPVQTKKDLEVQIILQSLNSAKHFKYLRLFALGKV